MADPTPTPNSIPPSKITRPITGGEGQAGDKDVRPFAPYMQKGEANKPGASSTSAQISPFDLAHGTVPPPGPTFDTIQAQTKMAQASMGELTEQLNTPGLKLKRPVKYLLKNKLTGARGSILSASTKLGTPTVEEDEDEPKGSGTLGKFLDLVTGGQKQLEATQRQLQHIAESGKSMNPADMLLVQVKLNKAQQQLEYSSMLLGKAVDDLKQMMNIQL